MLHHDIGTNVSPLLYAELALRVDGLQGYVDAMNEFNQTYILPLSIKLLYEFLLSFYRVFSENNSIKTQLNS